MTKGIKLRGSAECFLYLFSRTEQTDNRIELVCAWLVSPVPKYVFATHPPPLHFAPPPPNSFFILGKVTQAAAAASRATRSNKPEADTELLLSRTMTEAQDWSADQREDFFFLLPLSFSLPLITTPMDTDGHSQSKRSNPLDGTQWVSHEPSVVAGRRNWERGDCEK